MIGFRRKVFELISARIFYGWIILLIAGFGVFASGPGQSHTFSVFIGPISRDLDIGATAISSAYGLATLFAAFGLPLMGRLVDTQGVYRTFCIVVILLGFACISFGLASGIVWLTLGFGFLRFLGQGSVMLNSSNVVSHWFSRKRGFAMGLMLLGFVFSMAIHPPVSQWLIDQVGWRNAWFWLGVSTWILMLPLLLIFLHNAPEPLGLSPDGLNIQKTDNSDVQDQHSAGFGLSLTEAFHTSTFYIVAVGLFTMSMLITSLHFFQVPIFEQKGLTPTIAAWIFPLSAIVAVLTQPFVGRSLDRFPTHRVFGLSLIMLSLSLFAITFVQDLITALVYGVGFGVNNAFNITMFGYVWPRYFGRRHLGSIQGTGQMIGVVGASVGPIPLGIAFDLFGDYDVMLSTLALVPLVAAILVQFLKDPQLPAKGHRNL